jgi:hypothetical protein
MIVRSASFSSGDRDAMDEIVTARPDALSSVLRDVHVRSVVYCLSDFSAPWGFAVERSPVASFTCSWRAPPG